MSKVKDKKKRLRSVAQHTGNTDEAYKVDQPNSKDELGEHEDNHAKRKLRNKKRKNNQIAERESIDRDKTFHETEDGLGEQNGRSDEVQENEKRKLKKKKNKKEKKARFSNMKSMVEDNSERQIDGLGEQNGRSNEVQENEKRKLKKKKNKKEKKAQFSNVNSMVEDNSEQQIGKSRENQNKDSRSSNLEENLIQKRDADADEIYEISSGDEDYSKGMKKWIMEYHQRRPGLKVLQERIDDFITAHEAREEQERKEREALAAEDGWTVVTHHRGRKKTTDTETGVTVGSVAQAAVLDKMAKRKSKGVGLDFYRFQKREARKNEILLLQDKFEQDKRKIQQLRAARKFRPY
ncbi:uncharacterized protein [Coffea arabica]|uniref:Ribosomal RNA-processing protein 7 C-terminal domain-containing protein n=1 Tax=Coffea arabica TaxID=13443 RepID=A0A6P6TMC4_COFAR|nr:myb-like protein X [Coffea arabica]